MTNLVDIPNVVGSLITFFTMGGGDAALELIKGITVNSVVKLAELKDELLGEPEVIHAVGEFQQNPMDNQLKSQLEEVLGKALAQHPTFQQQTAVKVDGDIKAEKGSVAAAVISGEINIENKFND